MTENRGAVTGSFIFFY